MKFSRRKKLILTIILVLMIILLIPIRYLRAYNYSNNQYLAGWPLIKESTFTVRFIHSVMRTPVYEKYIINKENEIFLSETIFSSYGAGNPETTPYDFEITKEGFRIYNINQRISPLVYRTGAIIANHTMIINEKEIPFLSFSSPGIAVGIEVKRRIMFAFLFEEVLSWISKLTAA